MGSQQNVVKMWKWRSEEEEREAEGEERGEDHGKNNGAVKNRCFSQPRYGFFVYFLRLFKGYVGINGKVIGDLFNVAVGNDAEGVGLHLVVDKDMVNGRFGIGIDFAAPAAFKKGAAGMDQLFGSVFGVRYVQRRHQGAVKRAGF